MIRSHRSDYLNVYRPSFQRHLRHLINNGFYARDLDADDFAFIERVRERGTANASLANTDVALDDELQYWIMPYGIDHSVERRVGHYKRITYDTPTPNDWHARREQRQRDKAIAAEELAREQREWEAAQAERKKRQLLSDLAWQQEEERRYSTKVRLRHYVPVWKADLERADALRRKKAEGYEAKKRMQWAQEKAAVEHEAALTKARQSSAATSQRSAQQLDCLPKPNRNGDEWTLESATQYAAATKAAMTANPNNAVAAANAMVADAILGAVSRKSPLTDKVLAVLRSGGEWTYEGLQLACACSGPLPTTDEIKGVVNALVAQGLANIERKDD